MNPIHRAITSKLTRSLTGKLAPDSGVAAWSPAVFFAAGGEGIWLDTSDTGSMWQDSAGTIPAVIDGPVGRISDKSGRGHHATQVTDAARPILRFSGGVWSLQFDGVDDFLITNNLLLGSDKMTLWTGIRKLIDGATSVVTELSSTSSSASGSFALFTPLTGTTTTITARSRGNAVVVTATSAATTAAPVSAVINVQSDIAADSLLVRLNAAQIASSVTDQGTGNFGNFPLYIGMRNGNAFPFNGHLSSLIIRAGTSTAGEVTSGEVYTAGKTGVTLP